MRMFHDIALGLACVGCVASVDGVPKPQPSPEGTFGIVAQPRLGTVVEGPTSTASITFTGVHERPGYEILIQVLVADSWATIATTTSSHTASSTDATTYEWQVAASPAQLIPSRWPQGGIVRVRAIGGDGEELAGLFHDADPCLDEHREWRQRAEFCGGTFPSGLVLVSPADLATAPTRPRFLDGRGWVDELETARYYQAIGAPATIADFRARFALDAAAISTYFNAPDLGIGREMRCAAQADGGVACAVANYGEFGGDTREALDRAIDRRGAFATVAMVYLPGGGPNSVQFMVYGATGTLATSAQLDEVGDNQAIPNNCLNCHGSDATYDPITHTVTGGSFLPFDAKQFVYSSRLGFTERDQQGGLAALNETVRAAVTPANRELIAGWYPNGGVVPADFVPAPWSATSLDRQVYREVIAAACRGCHATTDTLIVSPSAFRARASQIEDLVCTTHAMPNAQVPLRRVWSGPARAYLATFLDLESCNP